ncbi:MAG: deoxyribonuclease HsdR [Porphyromonadaceae bacterium CG2_30_38_12]|nr:MAG: deoxyribonuclease HsdR [Porphyromonadaceae bacterium CG2_30_38_12]
MKRTQMLGLFAAMVAVSVATNITTNLIQRKGQAESYFQTTDIPTTYAALAKAPRAMDTDFTLAAELSVHAVVHVKTKTPVQIQQGFGGGMNDPFFDFFFGPQQRRQQPQREAPMQEGSGSGVIISNDGYIVTNNHVIDKTKEIEVTLNDKRTFKAKLVGADPNTDIALIKIEAEKLPVILFGNSDSVKIGEWVLAVGNPFNLTSTVTAGIVSAKARNINIINSQMKIESFIQTDAAVNPGNSGGALVNTRGELIGINTAIASQTGSYAGYAFAVPASIVKKVVSDIRQFGFVQRAVLGVSMGDITSELAKEKNLKIMEGAYVSEVVEGSAADKAGVKKGDVITGINDVNIKSSAQLQEQIGRFSPGDKITVSVRRENKTLKLNAELKNKQGSTKIASSEASIDMLGADFKAISAKLKDQFQLDYGMEVTNIKKGKLKDAGVMEGFLIVKINNQAIRSIDDIKEVLSEALNTNDKFKVLNIAGVYPNGKVAYYAVNVGE